AAWPCCCSACPGTGASISPERAAGQRLVIGQSLENRTGRAIITQTAAGQLRQAGVHGLQAGDLLLQLLQALAGQLLDHGAAAFPVLPQRQQLAYRLYGKSPAACALDEAQGMDILLVKQAVARRGTTGAAQQSYLLVMPDHSRCQTGGRR